MTNIEVTVMGSDYYLNPPQPTAEEIRREKEKDEKRLEVAYNRGIADALRGAAGRVSKDAVPANFPYQEQNHVVKGYPRKLTNDEYDVWLKAKERGYEEGWVDCKSNFKRLFDDFNKLLK